MVREKQLNIFGEENIDFGTKSKDTWKLWEWVELKRE